MHTWAIRLCAGGLLALAWFELVGPANCGQPEPKKLEEKVREIAGSAEFLRAVPKHFATLKAVDPVRRQVTLLIEGEVLPKVWPLVPDAEVKVQGWWGRLEQFHTGDRVWAWFKTDRKKQAVAISMIADEPSEQDIHGDGLTIGSASKEQLEVKAVKTPARTLKLAGARVELDPAKPVPLAGWKGKVFVQSAGGQARLVLSPTVFEKRRTEQKAWLRQRWTEEGLPGTAAFVHTFSGEMDLILDHEAMRWARSLNVGEKVTLCADPPIKALVKSVQPWRERTLLRLVVHSFDLADLSPGQRLHLLRTPPPMEMDAAQLPPDLDRPRSKQERIEWFLASIYCTCLVRGDRCTGHFYTLASCNPNGCGMPGLMRKELERLIAAGKTDREIFADLLKSKGPSLLQQHLLP